MNAVGGMSGDPVTIFTVAVGVALAGTEADVVGVAELPAVGELVVAAELTAGRNDAAVWSDPVGPKMPSTRPVRAPVPTAPSREGMTSCLRGMIFTSWSNPLPDMLV